MEEVAQSPQPSPRITPPLGPIIPSGTATASFPISGATVSLRILASVVEPRSVVER